MKPSPLDFGAPSRRTGLDTKAVASYLPAPQPSLSAVVAMRSGVAPGSRGRPSFGGDTMNRRVWGNMPRPTVGLALWGALLGSALLGVVGCTGPQTRLQSGEETEVERYGVKTIGDVTTVGNAEPLALGNVGLVVGLEGTGGEPANSNYRTNLEDDLGREKIKDIKKEMANA